MANYPGFLGKSIEWARINLKNWFSNAASEQIETRTGLILNVRPPSRSERDIGSIMDALKRAESALRPSRVNLYDLYNDIELDDDYKTATRKRISSLTNLELVYNIKGNVENEVTEWMKNPQWRLFKREILKTVFWGHSLFEFNYENSQFFWDVYPRKNIDPRRKLILVNDYDLNGIRYDDEEYDFLSELFSDEPLGWLLYIAFPVIYKRNGVGDWALYQELAGNNFNIFKKTSTGTHTSINMDDIVKKSGASAYVELPDGIDLQQQNRSSMSQNQLFKDFNRVQSNNILKLILGQSTTTNDDEQGSYAKSLVSLFEQSQVHKDDQVYILDYLNYDFKERIQNWAEFKSISPDGDFQFKESEDIVEDDKPKKVKEDATADTGQNSDQGLE